MVPGDTNDCRFNLFGLQPENCIQFLAALGVELVEVSSRIYANRLLGLFSETHNKIQDVK
jgi:hypothetical protein